MGRNILQVPCPVDSCCLPVFQGRGKYCEVSTSLYQVTGTIWEGNLFQVPCLVDSCSLQVNQGRDKYPKISTSVFAGGMDSAWKGIFHRFPYLVQHVCFFKERASIYISAFIAGAMDSVWEGILLRFPCPVDSCCLPVFQGRGKYCEVSTSLYQVTGTLREGNLFQEVWTLHGKEFFTGFPIRYNMSVFSRKEQVFASTHLFAGAMDSVWEGIFYRFS